ncbi:MAG: NAD(P)/FAD-dependent oxidoreductase [Myxococcota bacterium]|nr:NAD(P)/FAD-dependent oxidoreductase [Myxococcota bacterium]
MSWDLVVVGGGPAGLAVAIEARQVGLSVVVLDRRHPPLDKACGEGIMPLGVAWIERAGLEIDPDGVHPFVGIRFVEQSGGQTLVAEGRFCGPGGLGVRRLHLHRALVQRAEALGVELRWGVQVDGLESGAVQTAEGLFSARWIVGADGLRSKVREWAGLSGGPSRTRRFGVRRHYAMEPWTDFVEVTMVEGCEAYVTPVGPGRVGVSFLFSEKGLRFEDMLARFPDLERLVEAAEFDSSRLGAGPLRQEVLGVVSGRVALVGDASCFRDALTGEGLSLAFRQAHALVAALGDEDLAAYARAHRRIVKRYLQGTTLLLALTRWRWMRRAMVALLGRDPGWFSRILGVLVDERAWSTAISPWALAALVRNLVTGGARPGEEEP